MGRAGGRPTPYVSVGTYGDFERVLGCQLDILSSMKIISWNCCLNFAKKYEQVAKLNPDILIIQECEKLPIEFFPKANFYWTGHDERKGLGIITFGENAAVDSSFSQQLDYFLPLMMQSGQRVLAVWAFNHRAEKRFGEGQKGYVSDALNYYAGWLTGSEISIVAGDFNNSVVWDRGKKESNFRETNETLESFGYLSSYHSYSGEEFGDESRPTLYHTKNKAKPYHIDYVYLKGISESTVSVGSYEDWIAHSDHMPVIVEC